MNRLCTHPYRLLAGPIYTHLCNILHLCCSLCGFHQATVQMLLDRQEVVPFPKELLIEDCLSLLYGFRATNSNFTRISGAHPPMPCFPPKNNKPLFEGICRFINREYGRPFPGKKRGIVEEMFVRISIRWHGSYLALKKHEATTSMQSSSLLASPTGNKNFLQKNLAAKRAHLFVSILIILIPGRPDLSDKIRVAKKVTESEKTKNFKEKMRKNTVVFTVFLRFPWQATGVRASTPCSRTRRGLTTIIQGKNCGMDSWLFWRKDFLGIFNDPIPKKNVWDKKLRLQKKVSTSNQKWIFNIQVHFRSTTGQQQYKQSRLAVVSGQ